MSFVYLEVFAIHQPTCRCYGKVITGGIEMHAFKCFLDMKWPGFARRVDSVPVKDTIGRVRRCLNLSYQNAPPDTGGSAGRQKMTLTGLNRHLGQKLGDMAFVNCLGKLLLCTSILFLGRLYPFAYRPARRDEPERSKRWHSQETLSTVEMAA